MDPGLTDGTISLYGVTCAQIVRLIRNTAANGDSKALRYTVRNVDHRMLKSCGQAPFCSVDNNPVGPRYSTHDHNYLFCLHRTHYLPWANHYGRWPSAVRHCLSVNPAALTFPPSHLGPLL